MTIESASGRSETTTADRAQLQQLASDLQAGLASLVRHERHTQGPGAALSRWAACRDNRADREVLPPFIDKGRLLVIWSDLPQLLAWCDRRCAEGSAIGSGADNERIWLLGGSPKNLPELPQDRPGVRLPQ